MDLRLRIIKEQLRSLFLRLWEYPLDTPNILWSRGWYSIADWTGSNNYLYPAYPTRFRVRSLMKLKGKEGIIWLRLGSDPAKPEYENGSPGDITVFANQVLGKLSGPVVLITTDGDRTIPSGLPDNVVSRILDDNKIKRWYTQNLSTSVAHPKLRPIPIGIDLHTPIGKFKRTSSKARIFQAAIRNARESQHRKQRIWSDVHLEPDLGNLRGEPRGFLTETRDELRAGIDSDQLNLFVDSPKSRISLESVWGKYGSYQFVMSLPGHGLDCHRTWEALAMGAIVVTVHSPIDDVLRPFRVVFIERQTDKWWKVLNNPEWFAYAKEVGGRGQKLDLRREHWIRMIRAELVTKQPDRM